MTERESVFSRSLDRALRFPGDPYMCAEFHARIESRSVDGADFLDRVAWAPSR